MLSIYRDVRVQYYLGPPASSLVMQGRVWFDPAGVWSLDRCGVNEDQLRALFLGRSPIDFSALPVATRSSRRRRAGTDLCFSAPKSVSVLWAVASRSVRAQIESAQTTAVQASLVEAERYHETRLGRNGSVRRRAPLVAVLVLQGDARPDRDTFADPHLHTHVLLPNWCRADADGLWRACCGTELRAASMAISTAYQCALARELTARLGLEIVALPTGVFELIGVPEHVRQAFSQRRKRIKKHLTDSASPDTAAAARRAALATRLPKAVHEVDLRTLWRDKALGLGFGPDQVASILHRAQPSPRYGQDRGDDVLRELSVLHTSVSRADVFEAVGKGAVGVLDASEVAAVVDDLIARRLRVEERRDGRQRYLVPEAFDTPQDLEAAASELLRSDRHRIAVQSEVDRADESRGLALPTAIRSIVAGGDLVHLTSASVHDSLPLLRRLDKVYMGSGFKLVAATKSFSRAETLGSESGILCLSADRWIRSTARAKAEALHEKHVLVCEAAEFDVREISQLILMARKRGSKLVLLSPPDWIQTLLREISGREEKLFEPRASMPVSEIVVPRSAVSSPVPLCSGEPVREGVRPVWADLDERLLLIAARIDHYARHLESRRPMQTEVGQVKHRAGSKRGHGR